MEPMFPDDVIKLIEVDVKSLVQDLTGCTVSNYFVGLMLTKKKFDRSFISTDT